MIVSSLPCDLEKQGTHAYYLPEASFMHPQIRKIQKECFGKQSRHRRTSKAINDSLVRIKDQLYRCQKRFKLDLWIAETDDPQQGSPYGILGGL